MKSYSQYEEQTAILAAFEGWPAQAQRHFLDIGAWNAKDKSNTRALYELGFNGVMIEPSPGPLLSLLAEYGNEPRITLISAAVALEPGLLPLHITDDAVSTSSEAVYDTWRNAVPPVKYVGNLSVPVLTLEQISNQFGGFDFINFDAEGLSADLFNRAMDLKWEPRCICVEHGTCLSTKIF